MNFQTSLIKKTRKGGKMDSENQIEETTKAKLHRINRIIEKQDTANALLATELADLKEENKKMYQILKRIGDCDWCVHAELGEFDDPCIDCRAGSKFIPDYSLLDR